MLKRGYLFLENMIGSYLVAATALLLSCANAAVIDFEGLRGNSSGIKFEVLNKRATDLPIISADFPDPTILEDGNACK